MLIRLEDSLVRAELDTRKRDRVSGKLWLLGRAEPLELDLVGMPSRDMAGLTIRLRCEYPPAEQAPSLSSPQKGHLLSFTGATKKRIPSGAEREIAMRVRKRIAHEWVRRNVIHLEWINAQGSRVVLEATGLSVQVLQPTEWSPTPEEERLAEEASGRLRRQWMENQSFDRLLLPELHEEQEALSGAEKEADLEHRKMERLNDRIQSRLEKLKEFSEEEYERIYREERERIRVEFGEPEPEPLTPEQEADRAQWVEEMNRLTDEALEEWEAGDFVEPDRHPLLVQCDTLQEKVTVDLQESGWLPDAPGEEHPLRELNWGFHMATAKMSGGLGILDDKEWPPDKTIAGPILVKLKQVRGYFRDALTALDAADEENLGVSAWRNAVRQETTELLQETELLIFELRERLS